MSADILRYPCAQKDFNEVLVEQLSRTPWILFSGGFHALIVVILMLFVSPDPQDESQSLANVTLAEADEIPDEPIEIDPPTTDPEVQPDDTDPTDEIEVVDTTDTTDVDAPYEETVGESDFVGEATLTSFNKNDAIGLGGGAGGGSGRGGRRSGRRKGSKKTEQVVDKGLEWLSRHQSPAGFWDADGFSCQDGGGPCLAGSRGGAVYDTGVTGLALLAFLGAGESPRRGDYRMTVAKGVRWLMKSQDGEGCFTSRSISNFSYNQAIATLAMIEAYDLSRLPSIKRSAKKGLAFCLSMQNPYKAWRYGVANSQNDVSVTGWMAMVLKAAKNAKLDFDERSLVWARDYIIEMTSEETGRVGYVRPGEPTAREPSKKAEFPSDESEAMTAAGICTRIFSGEDPKNSRLVKLGIENLLLKKLPVWDQARGSIDMYYWYYGTLAMFQYGGVAWKKWNAAMKEAVIDRQRVDGAFSGSWDPKGPWAESGGRVYSTALMTMCLEVYYRYGRVFGTK